MNLIMRLLTALFSGISCAVLWAFVMILTVTEFIIVTLIKINDGIFDFAEFHMEDQYVTLMKALHGDDWTLPQFEEGEEDGN